MRLSENIYLQKVIFIKNETRFQTIFFLTSCFPTGPCCLLRKLSWSPNQSLPKYHIWSSLGDCTKIKK